MKKFIFSAAFTIIFCGYAAAQNNSAKQSTKSKGEKVIVKNSTAQKDTTLGKTSLKEESSSKAKTDSIKLKLPIPKHPVDADTTTYPMNKNRKK